MGVVDSEHRGAEGGEGSEHLGWGVEALEGGEYGFWDGLPRGSGDLLLPSLRGCRGDRRRGSVRHDRE